MESSSPARRVEILSAQDLTRTVHRLASQVLESAADSRKLMLLGIPTRGVALARVLAQQLETSAGHAVDQGSLDPTFIATISNGSAPAWWRPLTYRLRSKAVR